MSKQIELRMMERFSDRYRRIWVQKSTKFNNYLITLFPKSIGEGYSIISLRNFQMDEEDLVRRIESS